MNSFIDAVKQANKEIIDYISYKLKKTDLNYSDTIGEGGDNSLFIDLSFEQIFIDKLSRFGNIFTEERGLIDNGYKHKKIVIDPLDGSDNFLSNLAYYGSSVALVIDNETKVAVVTNFATGEVIIKDDDGKITHDNLLDIERKRVINTPNIAIFERAYAFPKITQELYNAKIKFRSPGAVALSLANARNYKFVLFAGKIRDFDVMAGLYICKDLNIYKSDEFLLIAKDKNIFDSVKVIIKQF